MHSITQKFVALVADLEATALQSWDPQILDLYTRVRDLANSTYDLATVNLVKGELQQRGLLDLLAAHYGKLYQRYELGILAHLQRPYSLSATIHGSGYVKEMLELCFDEFRYANGTDSTQMFFIGSGAVPLAPIYYLYLSILERDKRLGAVAPLLQDWQDIDADRVVNDMRSCFESCPAPSFRAIGIDCDSVMVSKSKQLLSDLKLDGYISILEGRGEEIELPPSVNLVLIAGNTRPRQQVLKGLLSRLSRERRHKIKIVLRTVASNTLGELLYEPFGPSQVAELCQIAPSLRHEGRYPPARDPAIYSTTQVFSVG